MDFTAFITELGIDKLPEEKQQAIFASVFRTLNKRMSVRLAHELSDEQKQQFEQAVVENNENALEDLEKIYPNFKQAYQEELDGLKDDMKALM